MKDMRLQRLLLVLFHECAFTMEGGDSIHEDSPIRQLEQFEVHFEKPSDEGSEALGDAVAQVRQAGEVDATCIAAGMTQCHTTCMPFRRCFAASRLCPTSSGCGWIAACLRSGR